MSIFEQQRDLESFGEDMLMREAQNPSGRYPQFLVITEMQRRKDLRQRAQAQAYEAQPTVAEKLMQETGALGGPGIPGADPGPPPGAQAQTPGMQQGIAKFANGGMVQGYQNGGPTDPWYRRMIEWLSADQGAPGTTMYDEMARGFEDHFLYEQGEKIPGRDPFPNRPPSERYYGPQRSRDSMRGPNFDPLFRPPDPRERGMDRGLIDRIRGHFSGLDELYGEDAALVGDARARSEDLKTKLQSLSQEDRDRLAEFSQYLEGNVEENPGTLEQELMAMRKSPDEMRREQVAVALSGLGSLIGGGTRAEIARGMAPLTYDVLDTKQAQRNEDIGLATEVGRLEQDRKDRNVALKTQMLESQGMATDSAREAALIAEDIESRVDMMASDALTRKRQGALSEAEALSRAESLLTELDAVMQQEELRRTVDPGSLTAAMNAIADLLPEPGEAALLTPEERQQASQYEEALRFYAQQYASWIAEVRGQDSPDLFTGPPQVAEPELVDPRQPYRPGPPGTGGR